MKRLGFGLTAVLLLSITVTTAHASNLLFLSHSILNQISDDERASLRSAVAVALEQHPDRSRSQWSSADGKIEVDIRPIVTYQLDQTSCRKTRFLLRQNGQNAERYLFDLCRSDNGWDISYTPASSFTEEDWGLLDRTLAQALEENEDGQPSSWSNHKSKHSWVVVPASNKIQQGLRCRRTAITIFDHNDQASNGSYRFCREADGNWRRRID